MNHATISLGRIVNLLHHFICHPERANRRTEKLTHAQSATQRSGRDVPLVDCNSFVWLILCAFAKSSSSTITFPASTSQPRGRRCWPLASLTPTKHPPSHLLGTEASLLASTLRSTTCPPEPDSSAQINIEIEDGTSASEAAHSLSLILAASRRFCTKST